MATRYKLKIVSKAAAIRVGAGRKVAEEAEILSSLNHPFIVKLHGRFQTSDELVFVMEHVNGGGDLWGLIHQNIKGFDRPRTMAGRPTAFMSLEAVQFYAGSIILALAHMHRHDVIYRFVHTDTLKIYLPCVCVGCVCQFSQTF